MSYTQPWSEEAERALLCSVLIDQDAAAKAVQKISDREFFKLPHSKVFRAVQELFGAGAAVDVVTVSDKLKENGDFDEVGYPMLASLIEHTPSSENVDDYVGIVHDKYTLRRLLKACRKIEQTVQDDKGMTAREVLATAESEIFDVTAEVVKKDTRSARDILWPTLDAIEERIKHGGEIPGVPTGYLKLDRMTSGLKPGHLVIVAGRPSMGKTSLAMNIATNAAIQHDIHTVVFSLEMSEQELVERMISSVGKVNSQKLRIGRLDGDDHQRMADAAGLIADAPIFINDTARLTPLEIKASIKRVMAEQKVGMVIVDYIQLMSSGDLKTAHNRVTEMTRISRELKIIARELEVPIIAISQLNRGPEGRDDPRPVLSDLRESGAIEQDADIVMFVFREEVYTGPINKKGDDVTGVTELLVRKQRNGPIGTVLLTFEKEYTKFTDVAPGGEKVYTPKSEDADGFPFA